MARAYAAGSAPRGQTGRQDRHRRLCTAELVAPATLFVEAAACKARAVRARFVARGHRRLAASNRGRPVAQAGFLRRSVPDARDHAPRLGERAPVELCASSKRGALPLPVASRRWATGRGESINRSLPGQIEISDPVVGGRAVPEAPF